MAGGVLRKMVWQLAFNVDASKAVTAKQVVGGLSGAFDKLTTASMYAAGAMIGVYTAAAMLARNTAQYSEEVDRIATGLDVGVEKIQQYMAAFKALGASTDDISDAFGTLVDRSKDAIEGNKTYAKEFKRVGIAVDELKGKNAGELFDLYIERSTKVKDRTDAITSAVRLFGDDLGRRLLPVMVENTDSMKRLMDMSRALGLVLSEKTIKAQRNAAIKFRELEFIVGGLARRLGSELIPAFEALAKEIIDGLFQYAEPIKEFFFFIGDRARNEVEKIKLAWRDFMGVLGVEDVGRVADAFERVARAMRLIVVGVLAVAAGGAVVVFFQTLGLAGVALALSLGVIVGLVEDLWVYFHGGISLVGVLASKFESVRDELDGVGEMLGAVTMMWDALVAEVEALVKELGYTVDGANQFERAAQVLVVVLLFLVKVVLAVVTTTITLVTAVVFLARGFAMLANWVRDVNHWFGELYHTAGDVYQVLSDVFGMIRGILELNPLTMIPAQATRWLQGDEVGLGQSMDRVFKPFGRINSAMDSGTARRKAAMAAAGSPSEASAMAARSGGSGNQVSVDQRNNVNIVLPQSYGSPEADGRAAARGFQEELNQGEALFPGAYLTQ
jgi:hypothetical protein